jgi:hypothetical protein
VTNEGALQRSMREFSRTVEITRDVRFKANHRLGRRQRLSAYIVSLLSLYVISLSLLPNIFELKSYQNQILLACSIILSVFIIFTSLIDGSQNFFYQGELLHTCARKVATIHHALKNVDISADVSEGRKQLEQFQEQYRSALDECPVNHSDADFCKVMADKPHLFPDDYPWRAFRAPWRLYYGSKSLTIEYGWMLPHFIAVFIISAVVYVFVIAKAPVAGG